MSIKNKKNCNRYLARFRGPRRNYKQEILDRKAKKLRKGRRAIARLDRFMKNLRVEYKAPDSSSYRRLFTQGWRYDGIHGRGSGMGYGLWREFTHLKYGRLAYETGLHDRFTKPDRERIEAEARHRYYDYDRDWYLLVREPGQTDDDVHECNGSRSLTGNTLDELDETLAELDADLLLTPVAQ